MARYQQRYPPMALPPVPRWSKGVLIADCLVLLLTGIYSFSGTIALFHDLNQPMLIPALMVWTKVIAGMVANLMLVSKKRRGMALAFIAALAAISLAIFNVVFTIGPTPAYLRYPSIAAHKQEAQMVFVSWTIAWNILYLFAARAAARTKTGEAH